MDSFEEDIYPCYLCIMHCANHKSEYSWAFKLVHMVFKNIILDKTLTNLTHMTEKAIFFSPWKHYNAFVCIRAGAM